MATLSSMCGAFLLFVVWGAAAIQVNLSPFASHAAEAIEVGPFGWMRSIFSPSAKSSSEAAVFQPKVNKTVTLELYYETQCPACLELLNTSLRQVFEDKEMRERIDFKLYPFGNALMLASDDVSEGYHFWHDDITSNEVIFMCQHGDAECLGNMIQACAIEELKTADRYVPLTLCMASYGFDAGIERSSYACGESLKIDMDAIKECALSRSGNKVEAKIGAKSDSAALERDHVPFVVINGVHALDADEGQLIAPLCASLSHPSPALCKTTAGKKNTGCGENGGHTCL